MKRSIQEIGMGGTYDEPEGQPPKKNPWAGRMKWKPHGNPRLHPDEEAALAGQQTDLPAADDLLDKPPTIAPHVSNVQPVRNDLSDEPQQVPVQQKMPFQKARFQFPKPQGEPPMRFAGAADIDALMAEIKAEEAKPPHQQNLAKITRLKADAMELMSQEESQRIQRMADRLIPRIEG